MIKVLSYTLLGFLIAITVIYMFSFSVTGLINVPWAGVGLTVGFLGLIGSIISALQQYRD